ncbi:MAG: SDR family oxidoreductase [Cyclobacteriaceae bacterium]
MKKTVLITGTSSGIGKSAVFEFAKNGWQVIATQRNPEKENSFAGLSSVKLMALDVTNAQQVEEVMNKVVADFGAPDVLVNNAGYGVDGAFEAMDDEVVRRQFETNVFGLMRVTRAAIKVMRPRRSGTIIQISSMGGKITFPLYSIYHATKFAVEGFTESLHYELANFNIRLKIVEPGPIVTEFYGKNRNFIKPENTSEYDDFIAKFNTAAVEVMKTAEGPEVVAKTIYKSATDQSAQLRYPVGKPGPLLLKLRKLMSDRAYFWLVRKSYKL